MTKEELKQEAEECMHNALYWLKLPISKENVEQGGSYILKLLEPREKRIEELEKENKVLAQNLEDTEILNKTYEKRFSKLEKENAELRKVAEFQQSSNMNTHLENKKLKEGLTVGSMWNKHLNSQNKALEEERDRYRNMTFDQREQLTIAKEIIREYINILKGDTKNWKKTQEKAEQFSKDCEVKK